MHDLIRKWWPECPDPDLWKNRLNRFYAERSDYHRMTAGGKNVTHPQVQLLLSLVRPSGRYAEIGCGAGHVCGLVGQVASVHGFDVSSLAVADARHRYASATTSFAVADGAASPLDDNSTDGTFCFEVLEHVWDPVAVLRDMARITKPGGFILVSCPNHFSLDLHLSKKKTVHFVEIALAVLRYAYDRCRDTAYVNLVPVLDSPAVFPDCDAVASLVPCNLHRTMAGMGCVPLFVDTYYMAAHSQGRHPALSFQANCKRPIVRWFGDHILFLAMKRQSTHLFQP